MFDLLAGFSRSEPNPTLEQHPHFRPKSSEAKFCRRARAGAIQRKKYLRAVRFCSHGACLGPVHQSVYKIISLYDIIRHFARDV